MHCDDARARSRPGRSAPGTLTASKYPDARFGRIRRLTLERAVGVCFPQRSCSFASGSSSVLALAIGGLARAGRAPARARCAAIALALRRGPRLRSRAARRRSSLPSLVAVAVVSALWSVDAAAHGRARLLASACSSSRRRARRAARPPRAGRSRRACCSASRGLVAFGGLVLLAVVYDDAVMPATTESPAGATRGSGRPEHGDDGAGARRPARRAGARSRTRGARCRGGRASSCCSRGSIVASGSRGALHRRVRRRGRDGARPRARPAGRRSRVAARPSRARARVSRARPALPGRRHPSAAPRRAQSAASSTRGIDAEHVAPARGRDRLPARGRLHAAGRARCSARAGVRRPGTARSDQAAERPIAGYGFGTEDTVFVDRFYSFDGGFVENTYLGLFLQLGAAGLGAARRARSRRSSGVRRALVRRLPRGGSGPAAAALGVLARGAPHRRHAVAASSRSATSPRCEHLDLRADAAGPARRERARP